MPIPGSTSDELCCYIRRFLLRPLRSDFQSDKTKEKFLSFAQSFQYIFPGATFSPLTSSGCLICVRGIFLYYDQNKYVSLSLLKLFVYCIHSPHSSLWLSRILNLNSPKILYLTFCHPVFLLHGLFRFHLQQHLRFE